MLHTHTHTCVYKIKTFSLTLTYYSFYPQEFLNAAADNLKVDSYLECSSKSTHKFYEHNGYKIIKQYKLKYKEETFKPDGDEMAVTMMVRKPNV